MKNNSHLTIPILLQKERLNLLLSQRVPDIELRDNVKVTRVKVDGKGHEFVLELDVSGIYDGLLYVHFIPRFDKVSHSLVLEDLRLEMEQKGLFSKGINWMINGVLKQKIGETIQSQLDKKLKEILFTYLNKEQKFDLPDGFRGQITVQEFDIRELLFVGSELKILVDIWGDIAIKLDTQKMA